MYANLGLTHLKVDHQVIDNNKGKYSLLWMCDPLEDKSLNERTRRAQSAFRP